ncbi:YdeI/OmpD-associated family protein [Boseaceae bacterium BT-24-1]|nr:YdeI/OmpD-associated family protein [Boseaceae bacterium BT-24-1]
MPTSTRSPKVDAYAAQAEGFARPILSHLRSVVHAACPEVVEDIKYGIPHFSYRGDYLCIFAAYRSHCSFTLYKDALMDDARLKANAALPAAKRFMGKLTTVADLPSDSDLTSWIKEAMVLNENGAKLPPREPKTPKDVEITAAFAAKLDSRPEIKAVFESKSPSFRKEYNIWIGDAKTEATRDKRIEEALSWIAEGKGRFWKLAKAK